jgi:hypothetical protein
MLEFMLGLAKPGMHHAQAEVLANSHYGLLVAGKLLICPTGEFKPLPTF